MIKTFNEDSLSVIADLLISQDLGDSNQSAMTEIEQGWGEIFDLIQQTISEIASSVKLIERTVYRIIHNRLNNSKV